MGSTPCTYTINLEPRKKPMNKPTHAPCQGPNCGTTGDEHSPQCKAEHDAVADDNDFPLGKACDLSGEGTCESCQ